MWRIVAPAQAHEEASFEMSGAAREIERYLHSHIPITVPMGVHVSAAAPERVELGAPLAPNINHRATVFGGSTAALAVLAAWSLLHLRLQHCGSEAKLVIQRSSVSYEKPITGDFTAWCELRDEALWQRFHRTLQRHSRARMTLRAYVMQGHLRAASFEGDFVALT